MELCEHMSFKKCKRKERVHGARWKSCNLRCSDRKCRQCGHCSSYIDRGEDKETMKYRIVDGCGSESSEEQKTNNCNRLCCKGHGCDKRNKYWREANTGPYARERSMSRENSSDSHNFVKFRCTTCRHSGRRRITCRGSAMARNCNEESNCGILDESCTKCNSTSKHDCSAHIDEEWQRKKSVNSDCKSHNFHKGNTYATKHSFLQCCKGRVTCMHCCHSRKRQHKHYSSESDEATTNVRRVNDGGQEEHGCGCHVQVQSSPCDTCWQSPHNNSLFGPYETFNVKDQNIIPLRRCIHRALASSFAGNCIQSHDGFDIVYTKDASEPMQGCGNGKANCAAWKNENLYDQDQCLELSLKPMQTYELKVEGASKNDLKLSPPNGMGELNTEGHIPSVLPDKGLESQDYSRETIKHGWCNELPLESSHIYFSVWNPNVDSSAVPQTMEESIPGLSFAQAPAKTSNSNSSENIVKMNADTTAAIIHGKSFSSLDQNILFSHKSESQCTVTDQSKWGSSSFSEDKQNPVSDHPVSPNQRKGLSPNLSFSHNNEQIKMSCVVDSQLATPTASAADYGTENDCIASELLQYERAKEFSESVIIIPDSEDDCSDQSSIHGLHEKNNLVSSCNISVLEEKPCYDNSKDPLHEITDSHVQGTLLATHTGSAADYGTGNDCIASELLQSERKKEFSESVIIIPDSEDDFSDQSSIHGLHENNNLVSSSNISVLEEKSCYDNSKDPLHEITDSHVQGTLLARNISFSGMKEFDLYKNTSLPNVQRKDEMHNAMYLSTFFSESCENIGVCTGSVAHIVEDKGETIVEDKCETIVYISSEDESIQNLAHNVNLPFKNGTLQESGGNILGDCVTSRGNDDMRLSDWETCSHEEDNNYEVVCSSGKDFLSDIRFHESLNSFLEDKNGNAEAVCASKGLSNSKHWDLSYVDELINIANSKPRIWDAGILCDLCGRGPSLIYGEWYAWCCGYRLFYCKCTDDHKRKLISAMNQKNKKSSKRWSGHQWSGKIHRMCGVWSSEVFEKDDGRDQLEGLFDAVKRGRKLYCKDPECRRFGATLGCRVRNCRRSFHYPCAVKLASQLLCRIWEGCKRPVACHEHRHVDHDCISAKKWKPQMSYSIKLVNPGNGNRNTAIYPESWQSHESISDNQIYDGNRVERDGEALGRIVQSFNTLQFLGQNLVCEDLSNGMEAMKIPCTNDIDDALVPQLEYITSSKFSEDADIILKTVLANEKTMAKPCSGCYEIDMDDPKGSISIHVDVKGGGRDQDRRIDWQGEPMVGRLPYDCYGLLQLGWLTIDVMECNNRCKCGSKCINRELQKGLQLALEVFKTKDRGWGVRTLEQIPRGRFVMEYVGEMMTQREASKRVQLYAEYNSSYLFNLDHPAVVHEDQLVLDGFKMSNVARFINHSCDGNLRIYRVYTETLDRRIFRIGLYACRDIEVGEELTYDYKFIQEEHPIVSSSTEEPSTLRCFCQAKNCRQVLSSGGI